MGLTLRDVLRQLCVEFGWSYAVFWKAIGFPSPMHLICEDVYYEQKPCSSGSVVLDLLLKKEAAVKSSQNDSFVKPGCQPHDGLNEFVNKMMASEVHVIGDGLVGESASTGNHQWIIQETLDPFGSISKEFAKVNGQIVGGIQTVVVIPVLPFGVIQLGSIQIVPENFGFVNHVRSLFMQLYFESGALPSDAALKLLYQKSHMYPSPVMLMSHCPSKDSCTNICNLLSTAVNGCNPGMVKSPAPQSSVELYSVDSSKFIGKTPPGTSEVITSKKIKETACPIGEPVPHMNSQLLRNQGIFPKLDMVPVKQALPSDTISECQNQPSVGGSVLSSNNLKLLDQQLLYASRLGTLETLNNLRTLIEDAKSASGFARNEPLQSATDFGSINFHPCRTTEGTSLSSNILASKAPVMSCQQNLTCSNFGIPEVLKENQPFLVNKVSRTVPNTGIMKEENDLAQISSIVSSESGMLSACSGLHAGTENHVFCSSNLVQEDQWYQGVACEENETCTDECQKNVEVVNDPKLVHKSNRDNLPLPLEHSNLGSDLFHVLDVDCKVNCLSGSLDDVLVLSNAANAFTSGRDTSDLKANMDLCPLFGPLNDDISCSGVSSVTDGDQLLDAVISRINSCAKQVSDDTVSCSTFSNAHNSHHAGSQNLEQVALRHRQDESFAFPALLDKAGLACSGHGKSSWSSEKVEDPQKILAPKSQILLWVDNTESIQYDDISTSNDKKIAEAGKPNRKRPRLGENPRPRPKDRQMIQDRIKELREIVPNGAKCSIDALLEKTIKHMLFLQSVTKHADKLKDTGEPKISNQEGGLLLKDNFEGGATWAFEVGTQSINCPIIVEDLNPPRQMLVEMLCEERGFFLEIADFIRGLGLTILKGIMEARKNKVWARFAVEANRDVTRMEIFLSLVRMLEPSTGSNLLHGGSNLNMPHMMLHQTSIPATGFSDRLP